MDWPIKFSALEEVSDQTTLVAFRSTRSNISYSFTRSECLIEFLYSRMCRTYVLYMK